MQLSNVPILASISFLQKLDIFKIDRVYAFKNCHLTPKVMGDGFFYLQPKRFEIELCNFLTFPNT